MTEASTKADAPRPEPTDAAWVRALPLVVAALVIFVGLKACGFVGRGSGGLVPGTYACFTATVTPSMLQPRTPEQLQEQTGQNAVRDVQIPNAMLVPAAFGNIIIDDDGGYTLTGIDGSGAYSVSGEELSFTGDLSGLTLRGFEPANHRFNFLFQDMAIECNLQR